MKFSILTFIIAISMAGSAFAVGTPGDGSPAISAFFFKPYVGADYQYTSVDYNSIAGTADNYGQLYSDSFNGGDIHIGARVHQYLGFEAGYFDTFNESKSQLLGTTAKSSAKFTGENFDAMGYIPLGETKAELIGLVGVSHITSDSSISGTGVTVTGNSGKTFAEFGGGGQYWLTNNLNARLLMRYQDVNSTAISSAFTTSVGLNWQF